MSEESKYNKYNDKIINVMLKDIEKNREYFKKIKYKGTIEDRVDKLEKKLDKLIKIFNKFFNTNLGDE